MHSCITPPPPTLLPSWLGLLDTLTAPLQRGKTPTNECPGYDTKQSVPVRLEIWGMRSILSLPSLPGPLCPEVVAPGRVLSMD